VNRGYGRDETADQASIFVVLSLVVQNNGHSGEAFIPQNDLKIVIGDNAFDAEDMEDSMDYCRNIEPTLIRSRNCYFEIPKAMLNGTFMLRFSTFLVADVNINVTVSNTPVSTRVTTPSTALSSRAQYDEEALREGYSKLRKEIDSEYANAPKSETTRRDSQQDYVMADDELNAAWKMLTPKQRAQNRNDERTWIKFRDRLPTLEERISTTRTRISFLQSLAGV
jgi:hypothetical protein